MATNEREEREDRERAERIRTLRERMDKASAGRVRTVRVLTVLAVIAACGGVALAVLAGYWASNQYDDWRAPKAWEYRIEAVEDRNVDVELDQLGAAGWELVHCRRATTAAGGVLSECTFKRRRRR